MNKYEIIKKQIIAKGLGSIREDLSFSDITTLQIGGKIRLIFYPYSEDNLSLFLALATKLDVPFMVMGGGSNVFASDKDYEGVVILLDKFMVKYYIIGQQVIVYSQVKSINFAYSMLKEEKEDFSSICTIPGTIGGAVAMNAGCFGKTISDNINECYCLDKDGTFKIIKKKEINFGYRTTDIRNKGLIIYKTKFDLYVGNYQTIKQKYDNQKKIRKDTQPQERRSAGCTFKNPKLFSAGYLIDKCGLKGLKIGNARISDVHANFLVADKNCKSVEMEKLINYVSHEVKNNFNIELEMEWIKVNFD